MRCIDADVLFNWGKYKLSDAVKYGNKDSEQQDFSYSSLMMYEIAGEIQYAPTIEPTQGEWKGGPDEDYMICSNCDEPWNVYDSDTHRFKFCPNCGADMRVGVDA